MRGHATLSACSGNIAALAGNASAADLIQDAPAKTIAATYHDFNWTGFYAGAHVGRGLSVTDIFVPASALEASRTAMAALAARSSAMTVKSATS
jgi:hypothetical protein